MLKAVKEMKNHFGEFDEGVLKALRKAYNPNANSFSESCEELYDFKTCQRPNGSVYGIPDKSSCQTGKEVSSSQGDNAMTNMRMAMGKDPRKLDIDVMQSLGPDALVKIYADNFVSGGGKKQEILAEKAKNRLLGIREGEIDTNQEASGFIGDLGKKFAENLANSIFIGETTQAQDKMSAAFVVDDIEDGLKSMIEKTGTSYPVDSLKSGLDGVQQLLADPDDRAVVVKALSDLGITGLDDLGPNVFDASKVSALVGGLTKEDGMTAQDMMKHGADALGNALASATARADSSVAPTLAPRGEGGPVNEMAPNPNADPTGMAKYTGRAFYTDSKGKSDDYGIKLNRTNENGVYKGEWSDGYKTEYQFGKDGQMRIVSLLKDKRDVSAAKWISGDGHTVITSKNGARTVIPEFYPGTGMPTSKLEAPND